MSINLKKKSLSIGTYSKAVKQVKWNKSSSINLDFDTLVYNPGYTFDQYLDENGRFKEVGGITIKPVLYIYCGSIRHYICNNGLSEAELWWLGKELSDFLSLELQIIHQMPGVSQPVLNS